jgi:hypothetical protein
MTNFLVLLTIGLVQNNSIKKQEVRQYQIYAIIRAQPLAPSSPKAGQSLKPVSDKMPAKAGRRMMRAWMDYPTAGRSFQS